MLGIKLTSGKGIKSEKPSQENRIKILNVGGGDNLKSYTIEKRQDFLPTLADYLLKIGFNSESFEMKMYFAIPRKVGDDSTMDDEDIFFEDPFSKEYLPINTFNEQVIQFKSDDHDIEVIFFSNNIVLNVRALDDYLTDSGTVLLDLFSYGNV